MHRLRHNRPSRPPIWPPIRQTQKRLGYDLSRQLHQAHKERNTQMRSTMRQLPFHNISTASRQFRTTLNNSKITNVWCDRFFGWEIRFLGIILPHTHQPTQPETDSQQPRGIPSRATCCTFLAFVSLVVRAVQRSMVHVLSGAWPRYYPIPSPTRKLFSSLFPN